MTEVVEEEKKDEFVEQDQKAAGFQSRHPPMNEVLIAKTLAAAVNTYPETRKLALIYNAENMVPEEFLRKAYSEKDLEEFRVFASMNRSLQNFRQEEIGEKPRIAVPWNLTEAQFDLYVEPWIKSVNIDWLADLRSDHDENILHYEERKKFTNKQRFFTLSHAYIPYTFANLLQAFLDAATKKTDELAAVIATLLSPSGQRIFEKLMLAGSGPESGA